MSAMSAQDIKAMMAELGEKAKAAALELSIAPSEQKNDALLKGAALLRANAPMIKEANAKDMAAGQEKGLSGSMLDRLMLDDARIEGMAKGLEAISQLDDPVGEIMSQWDRPNGLNITRVRVPLGVIGIIYESRPNVTADAGALSLKSGNVAILRGGSESFHSSHAIMDCLAQALEQAGLPKTCIQMIPTTDRAAVGEMLTMSETIDVIVPRGGKGLIERITRESKIPLFKHLDGICHIYVDAASDLEKARKVIVNGKMRRTGICGATETVLINRSVLESQASAILGDLMDAGCEVRGDGDIQALDDRVVAASEEDWGMEYLDAIVSVKVVEDVKEAVSHINKYGSHHTDCIITEDNQAAEDFLNQVDSAICVLNASTQYADGGEFGMGAEIGISTGKMHARGPVGVEQLTSFKYKVRGDGQCRP
ncbi:glutamate-5-semialdehyde dehydrogenase [Candidatus Terasakiella magnetica]|nr:glutamate-5-semialdehyde dehydrogenase [Candidatus Terasakiella magnetica]